MFRRAFFLLPVLAAAACAAVPTPPSRPARRTAPVPARPQPVPVAQRVRQEAWITRFWEQLTPAQQRRVRARLEQGEPPLVTSEDEAARLWDALGLPERDALVFRGGLPRVVAERTQLLIGSADEDEHTAP